MAGDRVDTVVADAEEIRLRLLALTDRLEQHTTALRAEVELRRESREQRTP